MLIRVSKSRMQRIGLDSKERHLLFSGTLKVMDVLLYILLVE
jgi:hypothetical protein